MTKGKERQVLCRNNGLGDMQANRKRRGYRREIPDQNPLPLNLTASLTARLVFNGLSSPYHAFRLSNEYYAVYKKFGLRRHLYVL